MNKMIRACIVLAAFAACAVVPAVASAVEVTSPTGTKYTGLIEATNVKHANTEAHTLMTTAAGNVTCNTATLTGSLITQNASHVTGEITTGEFKGRPSDPTGADCESPLGPVQITPNHTTNPTHNGVSSLPWCVTAAKGTITVRGGKCSEAARPLTFTMDVTTGFACTYEKASVTGTYTAHPNTAIATINKQNFTRITSGSIFCPGSGELDMAFELKTDPGKAAIYIDG